MLRLLLPSNKSILIRIINNAPFCSPFRLSVQKSAPRIHHNCTAKGSSTKQIACSKLALTPAVKICVGLASGLFANCAYQKWTSCEGQNTRLASYKRHVDKELKFDWRKLWSYVVPHIWHLIAAVAGALVVAILNIQIPQLMGGVINVIAQFREKGSESFTSELRLPALKLIAMYIAQSFFTFSYIYLLSSVGEQVARAMKTDLFAAVLRQDIAFFDEQRTGEVMARLTIDVQDFKSSFKQCISQGLRSITQIIGCGISLMFISSQMTYVTLLLLPTIITIGTLFGGVLRVLSRLAQAQMEKSTAVADEAISNIRTVRAFAMEDSELQLFSEQAEKAQILNEKLGFGIGMFQGGTNLFLNGMVLVTVGMGGYLLSTNQLSAGQLMAYLMATQTIQRSLAQLSLLFGSVIRGIAAGARVFEYINMQPSVPLRGGEKIPYHSLVADIEFKNVTFAYPSRSQHVVLKKFNLKIPAGKTVAIVGASGSGKSTIVALLERFYDVDDGAILIDGKDVKSLDPSWLRQQVFGFISQEPVLFATTVRENIRYGRPSATDSEVEAAAQLANADEFIKGFPKGYDTVVGERGATLSGGQKQRIAIARALIKKPAVLLLDEATSALDTESEKIVQVALDKAIKGRTVVVIAHRMSTIQNADIIVVLSAGKIVEIGTHETLKKLKGHYWSLIQQQRDSSNRG